MVVWAWIVLVVGGVAATVATLTTVSGPAGFAVFILTIGSWVAFGLIHSHLVGARRFLQSHFGRTSLDNAHVLKRSLSLNDRANIQLALEELHAATLPKSPVLGGTRSFGFDGSDRPSSILAVLTDNSSPKPIVWEQVPSSLNQTMSCPVNALYLLRVEHLPIAAHIQVLNEGKEAELELEVLALDAETAHSGLKTLLDLANKCSIYRGSILSLQRSPADKRAFRIQFHELPVVERASIVLPDSILQVIERNVLGLIRHGETLRRTGRNTRHGILLHGPPGTGKTMVTKYLARACTGYTTILLSGKELSLIRESCQFARMLAPSFIVFEDVDLVAGSRSKNRNTSVLHELLDEMDGLGPKADCIFLFTTNRADILEPALAGRPGRVDQVVLFPLPDRECRRRLFDHFTGKHLDLSSLDLEMWLDRTEGASPAFLEELFHKSVLLAAERGAQEDPLKLIDHDLAQAIRELLEFGGNVTRSVIGFATYTSQPDAPQESSHGLSSEM